MERQYNVGKTSVLHRCVRAAGLVGLVLAGFGCASVAVEEETASLPGCEITRIVDGDTVDVDCGSGIDRVRLMGFDTPESFRAQCSSEAARALAAERYLTGEITRARIVDFEFRGRDRFDRALAVMRLDGQDIADVMVSAGHARRYDGGRRQGWCG